MAGRLSGIVQGFDAGTKAAQSRQMADLDQQKLDLETQKQDQELQHQKNFDTLGVVNTQIGDIANAARPHRAYLDTAPDPAKDPDGYKSFMESDITQQHLKAAKDLNDQAGALLEKKDKTNAAITGFMVDRGKQRAAQNMAGLVSGQKQLSDLSPGEKADLFTMKSKLPQEAFVVDPKTGRMPAQDYEDAFQKGIQTHDWSGAGDAITAMLPETQFHVGDDFGGGKISGVKVIGAKPDADGKNLLIQKAVQIHMPDGSTKTVSTPEAAQSVPMDKPFGRAANLQKLIDLAAHPDMQGDLNQSLDDRTSTVHQLNDTLRAAGTPEAELMPAPTTYEHVKRGEDLYLKNVDGSLRAGPDGQPMKISGQSYVGQNKQIFDELQDAIASGDQDRIDAALGAAAAIHPNKYAPGGPGGGAPAAPQIKQGTRILAQRAAEQALGAKYGYHRKGSEWLDKDGNPADNEDFQQNMADVAAYVADADDAKSLKTGKVLEAVSGKQPGGDRPRKMPQVNGVSHPQSKADYDSLPAGSQYLGKDGKTVLVKDAGPAPTHAAPPAVQVAAAKAANPAKPSAATGADQGAAIRKLAEPVNYGDYVKTGPSGSKRDINKDLAEATSALTQLQTNMGDRSLPEAIRADFQHRFAAELMRRNELAQVKAKVGQ